MTELATVSEGPFSATVTLDDAEVVMRLAGNADAIAKKHLERLLTGVHDEARRAGVRKVQVDMRNLAFMNSSCIKDFVTWLAKARQGDAANTYKIVFVSSAAQHWQKRSLHALSCFAHELVTVEVG